MKSLIKVWAERLMWAPVVALMLGFAACSSGDEGVEPGPEPVVEPNFPTLTTAAVEAGELYTLNIEPNMDWVVKVPTETAAYFQILDNGNLRYEMRGSAGKHQIQIQVADITEYDKEHTCEVTMTMNGESKTIARLTLYPEERVLRVAVAQVDTESGDFIHDEEYNVVFAEQSATGVDLVWPIGTIGYMQWLQVEANFPWTIGGDIPAWISLPVTSGEAGLSEGFRMDTNWAYYPDEQTTGKLLFQDLSGEEAVTVLEFEVTIPGVKEYCSVELAASLSYDVNGYFYNNGAALEGVTAIGSIVAMKGAQLYVLNLDKDGNYSTEAEWVLLTEAEWDSSEGDGGLQRRSLNVGCAANDSGKEREAVIVALPKPRAVASAAELLEGGKLKDAYKDAVVSEIFQETTLEAEPCYSNNFDFEAATQTYGTDAKYWPYLDQFDGWMNEVGTGVETVTYSYKGVSVRNNSNSLGEYSDYEGSGVNNIFFGSSAYLQIENITVESTSLCLTFGGEKYLKDTDNVFSTEEFLIRLSADGQNWSAPIAYTAPESVGRWNVGHADFTLPEGTYNLYIRFDAKVDSAYSIDDVTLTTTDEAGQSIAFDAGPITPDTPEVVKATVQEFLNAEEGESVLYELTGEVTSVANETYGNFYLKDATAEVYIYGLCSPEGEQKYWAASGVKVGDTITIRTIRSSYDGVPQGKNAIYVSHTPAGGDTPEPQPSFDTTDYESGTVTATTDMEIVFWYPEGDGENPGAADQGASLRRVVSGTLYDKYSSYGVPIYWLVYTGDHNRNMCMLKNLPNYYKKTNKEDTWLDFEPGEYAIVTMDQSALGNTQATGAVALYSNATRTRCKYVLVCTWRPE